MDTYPLVILANEPNAYRSLLAAELPFLRPNLRVLEINPAEIDSAVTAFHPSIVICSRTLEHAGDAEMAILVLHAEAVDTSLQTAEGTILNPRLSDILRAIDRVIPADQPDRAGETRSASTPTR